MTASYAMWGKVADLSSGWIFRSRNWRSSRAPSSAFGGWGWGVGIFLLGLVGMIPGIWGRERYYQTAVEQPKVSLRLALGSALRNKALLILMALCMLKVMPSMLASSMDHLPAGLLYERRRHRRRVLLEGGPHHGLRHSWGCSAFLCCKCWRADTGSARRWPWYMGW